MTQVARPAPGRPRRLDAFELPSEPGNERLALARVADSVRGLGLPEGRLEKLKTAVAEATMNAIEHGNKNRAEIPVEVEVTLDGDEIIVAISDQGGEEFAGTASAEAFATTSSAEEPDLLKKLDGGQSPRGWGLFLIRNMVDAMDVTTNGQRHTIWLTMRTGGAAHGEHV
jgi:anti-sigma regulatory factor (Ser/Thr protein kinase)